MTFKHEEILAEYLLIMSRKHRKLSMQFDDFENYMYHHDLSGVYLDIFLALSDESIAEQMLDNSKT